jgi:uracil permease
MVNYKSNKRCEKKSGKISKKRTGIMANHIAKRRFRWIFKSGVLTLGAEHFLAMFPATILVPLLINNKFNASIIDIALALFTSGIGTIAFLILSKGKIPVYVGSSFAFIGLTMYLIASQTSQSVTPQMAYAYIGWAYAFSGAFLIILSLIYQIKGIAKFLSFILPASVVGPAISLIGLELADTAIADSGFSLTGVANSNFAIISISTLIVIVLMSITRHKFLKNAAIVVGMVFGYIIATLLHVAPDWSSLQFDIIKPPLFSSPFTQVPPNLVGLFISVIPATLIIFTENIGRITVVSRMTNGGSENQPIFNMNSVSVLKTSVFGHGTATLLAAVFGSVPNTIYAENIAVMGIHSTDIYEQQRLNDEKDSFIKSLCEPFSYIPFLIAAIIAILVSFFGVLQTVLLSIPKPVIGGIELFLFGIISAPGIQLLVEQKVNYKKISNQLLTASVLISGISGLTVNLGLVELKGMSLGFVVGVFLNLLIRFLKWTGRLNDFLSFDEIIGMCSKYISKEKLIYKIGIVKNKTKTAHSPIETDVLKLEIEEIINFSGISVDLLLTYLSGVNEQVVIGGRTYSVEYLKDIVSSSTYAAIGENNEIIILKTSNSQNILVNKNALTEEKALEFLTDYRETVDGLFPGYLRIPANGDTSMRIIKNILSALG